MSYGSFAPTLSLVIPVRNEAPTARAPLFRYGNRARPRRAKEV